MSVRCRCRGWPLPANGRGTLLLDDGSRHGPERCVNATRRGVMCKCGAMEVPPGCLGRWGDGLVAPQGDNVPERPYPERMLSKSPRLRFHTLRWCDGMTDELTDALANGPHSVAEATALEESAARSEVRGTDAPFGKSNLPAYGGPGSTLETDLVHMERIARAVEKDGSSPPREEDSNPCSVPEAAVISASAAGAAVFDGSHRQDSNSAPRQSRSVIHAYITIGRETIRVQLRSDDLEDEQRGCESHVTVADDLAALIGHPGISAADRCTALAAAAQRLAAELKEHGQGVWARQLGEAAARLVAASVGVRQ